MKNTMVDDSSPLKYFGKVLYWPMLCKDTITYAQIYPKCHRFARIQYQPIVSLSLIDYIWPFT